MTLVQLPARLERVLVIQLDGKLPNLALMRIAAHHRDRGDHVELRHGAQFDGLFDQDFDRIYGSAIFERSRPLVERLRQAHPSALIGGTGVDAALTLESKGITTERVDYSLYPEFRQSIGFSQRGCRLRCAFCVVPTKEGRVRQSGTIADIWRGDPWPREVILLDNDFFGQEHWRERIEEMKRGCFRVCFTQGINARIITEEQAEAIASVDYRDSLMNERRLYTAWDRPGDEAAFFRGLGRLVKYGVRPRHLLVYMLIGYWPGERHEDREHRRRLLREFGALPYPMPYVRTRELVGYQRWVIGAYDKRVNWTDWESARYQPRQLHQWHPEMGGGL
jgi:hypothetical protein